MIFWIYALIEERWRSPEVPYFGRVAGKQDICTAEAAERSRKAPPGRFQGHRENPTLPRQSPKKPEDLHIHLHIFTVWRNNPFIYSHFKTNAKHLKS